MSKLKLVALSSLAFLFITAFVLLRVSANRVTSNELSLSPTQGEGTAPYQLLPVITGLSSTVHVANARDGSNRLFIVQQGGIIKVLQPGATTATDFINISTRVLSGGERGLLGLAFHPQYALNRRFFVYYTRAGDGAIQIAEYTASSTNPNVADTDEKVIITVLHPSFGNHNGGTVAFGPDGYLYAGLGDGGSGNDPSNNAQNINQLLGKIIRLNIDVPGGTPAYTSPSSNPFFGATAGADEIYMVGMRNPYRFSFDRGTGELWIGDVGQNALEEIDIGQLGGNFGWRTYEGNTCTNLNAGQCVPANFIFPIAQYSITGARCAITGGYRYRGRRSTFPAGTYVYADYCTGEILMLVGTTETPVLDTILNISSFGEDEAGEIYVVSLGGGLYRLVNPNVPLPRNVVADFDGDLKSDVSIFRRSTGVWYTHQSFTNSIIGTQFGLADDTVTPGDYDGDGRTDLAVWRDGVFYVLRSSNSSFYSQQWGQAGDDARVVADYDGDKKTDLAVFRTTGNPGDQAEWYMIMSSNGALSGVSWGLTGDLSILGDYDGDGRNDVAVYRPSTGVYYVIRSRDGALISLQFGQATTDTLAPGDYDGDGTTDFAVYRHTTGAWYILQSSNGQMRSEQFGAINDRAVPGDYDGDGKNDLAVTRDESGNLVWYVLKSSNGALLSRQWGLASDDYEVESYQTR